MPTKQLGASCPSNSRTTKHGITPAYVRVLLALIIVVFLLVCLLFGLNKQGLFQDESWTFFLANGFYLDAQPETGVIYHDGDPYRSWASVQNFLGVDFSQTLQNVTDDNHPPLYFLLFSLVYSFFPGSTSYVIGVMLNAVFISGTIPLVYATARRLNASCNVSLVVAAGWAFSVGAIDSVLFLRMYAMLTFFFCLLTWAVVKIFDEQHIRPSSCAFVFATCVLGFLTQYFFMIYAFALCLCAGVLLLIKRKFASAFAFGGSAIAGIAAGVLIFPESLNDVFQSSRGVEALNAAVSDANFIDKLLRDWAWISSELFANTLPFVVLALVLLFVLLLLLHKKDVVTDGAGVRMVAALGALAYVAVVAKVAPFASNRYLLAVYPVVFIVVFVYAAHLISCALRSRQVFLAPAVCVILAVSLCVVGFATVGPRYLNWEDEPAASLSDDHTTAVVVWSDALTAETLLPYVLEYQNLVYFDNLEALSTCDFSDINDTAIFVSNDYLSDDVSESSSVLPIGNQGYSFAYEGIAGEYFCAYASGN